MFSPAKSVDHSTNGERPYHAPHTEDGNSKAPHHGVGFTGERLSVPLHGHILEKHTQSLENKKRRHS